MCVYAAMFIYSLCCFSSRKRFGTEKKMDGNKVYLDTYSSRLIDFRLLAIIALTTIYAPIKIWGRQHAGSHRHRWHHRRASGIYQQPGRPTS